MRRPAATKASSCKSTSYSTCMVVFVSVHHTCTSRQALGRQGHTSPIPGGDRRVKCHYRARVTRLHHRIGGSRPIAHPLITSAVRVRHVGVRPCSGLRLAGAPAGRLRRGARRLGDSDARPARGIKYLIVTAECVCWVCAAAASQMF